MSEIKLCACGCNRPITIEQYKNFDKIRFIPGHQNHRNLHPIRHLSDEAKKKISLSHTGTVGTFTGKHHSNETKDKMRESKFGNNWNKGRHQSKEIIETRRLKLIGKKRSNECRIRMSILSRLRWRNPDYSIKVLTGKISKCQLKLYNFLKNIFPSAVLEYGMYSPYNSSRRMFLDIALVEDKIDFEYDSIRWHSDTKYVVKDKMRDDYLQLIGWTVMRITEKELDNFIM